MGPKMADSSLASRGRLTISSMGVAVAPILDHFNNNQPDLGHNNFNNNNSSNNNNNNNSTSHHDNNLLPAPPRQPNKDPSSLSNNSSNNDNNLSQPHPPQPRRIVNPPASAPATQTNTVSGGTSLCGAAAPNHFWKDPRDNIERGYVATWKIGCTTFQQHEARAYCN